MSVCEVRPERQSGSLGQHRQDGTDHLDLAALERCIAFGEPISMSSSRPFGPLGTAMSAHRSSRIPSFAQRFPEAVTGHLLHDGRSRSLATRMESRGARVQASESVHPISVAESGWMRWDAMVWLSDAAPVARIDSDSLWLPGAAAPSASVTLTTESGQRRSSVFAATSPIRRRDAGSATRADTRLHCEGARTLKRSSSKPFKKNLRPPGRPMATRLGV